MERLASAQLVQLRAELKAIANASPRYVRLDRNRPGRDFVIGDAHGAFDQVWRAMKLAGFDRSRDRLCSVGDLVDRDAALATWSIEARDRTGPDAS